MHFKIYSNSPRHADNMKYILVYEHENGNWKRVIKFDDLASVPPVEGGKWIAVPIMSKYRRHKNRVQSAKLKSQYSHLVFDSRLVGEDVVQNEGYFKKLAIDRYYYYRELEKRLSKYEDVPLNPNV